uniref:Uncharacterized protein n=1 Tax=Picea glauca TaxID=3330 RepID=A0A117NGL2_PICGL|nr:hypothetical protein ABT39_MTgene6367 [Picea glauca]QHR86312.1 hypothetical protein Q903MT_gene311 [Picea sitchensis]
MMIIIPLTTDLRTLGICLLYTTLSAYGFGSCSCSSLACRCFSRASIYVLDL